MRERTRQAGPRLAAALVLLGLSAGGVAAQSDPSPATPPGNEGAPIPDTGVPPKSGTLSDQLSRSEGVIKPPPATTVDPGMVKPTPNQGAPMVVVPPPGTPGSDPNVRPK